MSSIDRPSLQSQNEKLEQLIAFLRHVLPHEGWKVAIAKTDRGMHHEFVETFEQQAERLLFWSARGHDTYFACATYQNKESRKQTNVHQIKSLWADIDTRLGKPNAPYADQIEAAKATVQFCQAVGLPAPIQFRLWPAYLVAERTRSFPH